MTSTAHATPPDLASRVEELEKDTQAMAGRAILQSAGPLLVAVVRRNDVALERTPRF